MKPAVFIIAIIALFSLVCAATESESYSYEVENWRVPSYINANIQQTLNEVNPGGAGTYVVVCVGDKKNLREYVEYSAVFPDDAEIKSYCDRHTKTPNGDDDPYNCDPSKYTRSSNYGIGGNIAFLSDSEYNTVVNDANLDYYVQESTIKSASKNVINKITKNTGYAWLYAIDGGTSVQYAKGVGGIGCDGTYRVRVTAPDGSSSTVSSGNISDFGSALNYEFKNPGYYEVAYTTTIEDCTAFFKEQFKDGATNIVHPFQYKTDGPSSFGVTEHVKFNVVNAQTSSLDPVNPTIDQVVDSNGIFVPKTLQEEKQDTFTIRFKLENKGQSDVTLTKLNNPIDLTSPQIKINSVKIVRPTVGNGVTVHKGESVEVVMEVTATPPKGSKGKHQLEIDYAYEASAIGICAGAGTDAKTGKVHVNIDVVKDQVPQDHLHLNVLVAPSTIDTANYAKLANVKVYGTVYLDNNVIPPNGADVTLIEIRKRTWPTGCTPGQMGCPMSLVTCYSAPKLQVKTDVNTGAYSFDNVPLSCKIGADQIGTLEATVSAVYETYTVGPIIGTSSINTAIPDPTCVLTYKRVPSTTEEKYKFTIRINQWQDIFSKKSANVDCGDGVSGEKDVSVNDNTFECSYGSELTPEQSRTAVYTLEYTKADGQSEPYPKTICTTSVGMCYFQLG